MNPTLPGIEEPPNPPPVSQSGRQDQSDVASSINRRALFIPVAIALVILGIYNIIIFFAAKHTQRQHLLTVLDHLSPSTSCVFLGNSLIEAGCDPAAFQTAWPQNGSSPLSVNLGLGATTPVEHYLILKRAFSHPSNIKYVIYGFFDDQLNAAPDGKWEDLIGNRAFSYYFPREAAALYAPGSLPAQWQLELTKQIPMLAERSSLWDRVELLRRNFDEIGLPKQSENRFGRVGDFNSLEAPDIPDFTRRCEKIVLGKKGFSAPVQAIIDLAHQHGAKVFFVEMPMSPKHRELFYSLSVWSEARKHLQTLANEQLVTYITASDWVPNGNDFEDALHLNEQGARFFSARLGSTMAQLTAGKSNHLVAATAK